MKFKKIAAAFLLVLTAFMLLASLTSCSSAEDLKLPKQTSVNLEFNFYDVEAVQDKSKLEELGAASHLSNLIRAKKDDESIVICYCKSDKAKDDVLNYFKNLKNSSPDKYEDYEYEATVFTDEKTKTSINIVYFGTSSALDAAVEKGWTAQLYHTFIEDGNYKYLLKGFGNTLIITLGALLIGVFLGIIIAVAKYYSEGNPRLKIVNFLCDLYTTVIRGIPITVLLLIFFFIILVGADGILVAIIAFGINSGAYMAELVRSGINAVDPGQMEAARSLGLSKWQAMRSVIFPQAVKNILPAIGNECIALLKETSVAGYVAVVDLTRGANLIRNNTYDAFNPLILSALVYLGLVVIMTKLLSILERRLAKSERRIRK